MEARGRSCVFGSSDFDDMSVSGSDSYSSGSFSTVADEDVSSIFILTTYALIAIVTVKIATITVKTCSSQN